MSLYLICLGQQTCPGKVARKGPRCVWEEQCGPERGETEEHPKPPTPQHHPSPGMLLLPLLQKQPEAAQITACSEDDQEK